MNIINFEELNTGPQRTRVLKIIEAGINAVLPENIMKLAIKFDGNSRILSVNNDEYSLGKGRIFVIGGGKAAGLMSVALEEIVKADNIVDGIVNCKGTAPLTDKIRVNVASHPFPDRRGMNGVAGMLALKDLYAINEDDYIICLISGGGSALMPFPTDGISLEDNRLATELLVNSGAAINEINTVRKHISQVKGGNLGRYYAPATVVSLILSDVIGNDLSVIASGPTFPDKSTFTDAWAVLTKYNLVERIPEAVLEHIKKGIEGKIQETPKELGNCRNYIIGDNNLALNAMREKAEELQLKPYIITAEQKGNATDMSYLRSSEIINGKYKGYDTLLIGGETTLNVSADAGKGGRNQHYAAGSIRAMENYSGKWVLASVGTDGSDFLPDVAGAIVDESSLDIAESKGIDIENYLARFNSNEMLDIIGNSLVITGDTGTNVGDIIVYLLDE